MARKKKQVDILAQQQEALRRWNEAQKNRNPFLVGEPDANGVVAGGLQQTVLGGQSFRGAGTGKMRQLPDGRLLPDATAEPDVVARFGR